MDFAIESYINRTIDFPIYGPLETVQSVVLANGGSNELVNVTPKGNFEYLLIRYAVLSYSSAAAVEFTLFNFDGTQVYADIAANARSDQSLVVPIWRLQNDKILIQSSSGSGNGQNLGFVVHYQRIQNDPKLWYKTNMKHELIKKCNV